jgi:hypothetical protein
MLDQVGYQKLGFTSSDDVVVSLCTPWIGPEGRTPSRTPPEPVIDRRNQNPEELFDSEDRSSEDDMYSMYDASFSIVANNNTLTHRPLSRLTPVTETTSPNRRKAKKTNFSIPTDEQQALSLISHKIRPTDYTLVFTGAAIRLNYPVPHPNVMQYGGRNVIKVGEDYIRPFTLGSGVDITTGRTYAIHGLTWQKKYTLPAYPMNGIINSDGQVPQYV